MSSYDNLQYPYVCLLPEGNTFVFSHELESFKSTSADGEHKLSCYNDEGYLHYSNGENSAVERLSYAEISARLQFEYIGHVQYESSKDLHHMVFEIPDEMKEGGQYTNEEVCRSLRLGLVHDGLVIKHVGVKDGIDVGHGLFALVNIPAGTFLGEYTGVVSTSVLAEGKSNYCCQYPSCDGGTYINAAQCGNIIRFINHSPSPNVWFQAIYVDGTCHIICVSVSPSLLLICFSFFVANPLFWGDVLFVFRLICSVPCGILLQAKRFLLTMDHHIGRVAHRRKLICSLNSHRIEVYIAESTNSCPDQYIIPPPEASRSCFGHTLYSFNFVMLLLTLCVPSTKPFPLYFQV